MSRFEAEGHQFTRLREKVLKDFTEGLQQHTLTAFWHYLLLVEIANKLLDQESTTAWRDDKALEEHRRFQGEYEQHSFGTGDFSERLMALVDRIVDGLSGADVGKILTQNITDTIYRGNINELSDLVTRHLVRRKASLFSLITLTKASQRTASTQRTLPSSAVSSKRHASFRLPLSEEEFPAKLLSSLERMYTTVSSTSRRTVVRRRP